MLENQETYYSFTGNGASTVFAFGCRIFSAADLVVTVAGAVKAIEVDYTLAGIDNPAGGTVTFLAGHIPAVGELIELERILSYVRATSYSQNGDFRPETVDNDQDYQTALVQQMRGELSRAILLPRRTTGQFTLPEGPLAGMLPGFDANGVIGLFPYNPLFTAAVPSAPWVDSRGYGSMAASLAAIGSVVTTLIVANAQTVTADMTIPSTLMLRVENGGVITVAAGKTLTINGPFSAPPTQVFAGTGSVRGLKEALPEWFSATGGVKQAVDSLSAGGRVLLSARLYTEPETIHILLPDIAILGVFGDNYSAVNFGTTISFSGTETAIEIGVDSGHDPLADGGYDGIQGFRMEDVKLYYTGTTRTNLSCLPASSYGTAVCGIRDWRGGWVRLKNVWLASFEYGFYGLESDLNNFESVTCTYCKVGVYAGPRSDQFTLTQFHAALCDQGIIVDQSTVWIDSPNIVGTGCEALYPIEIKKVSDYFSKRIVTINNAWFEKYQGYTGKVNAFIGVGVNAGWGGGTVGPTVVVNNTLILTNNQANLNGYTKAVIEMGVGHVQVDTVTGSIVGGIAQVVSFIGGYITDSTVFLKLYRSTWTLSPNNVYEINDAGVPVVNYDIWTNVGRIINTNMTGLINVSSRQWTIDNAAGTVRDIGINTAGVGRWTIRADSNAESGGNAGSDFQIICRDDTGAIILAPLTIKRSTGRVKLGAVPTYASNAAAIGAGMTAGEVYRTSTGTMMIVY
jgi:hypothetical protein